MSAARPSATAVASGEMVWSVRPRTSYEKLVAYCSFGNFFTSAVSSPWSKKSWPLETTRPMTSKTSAPETAKPWALWVGSSPSWTSALSFAWMVRPSPSTKTTVSMVCALLKPAGILCWVLATAGANVDSGHE